ncbi:MAG: hypothetical protein M1360_02630 [Candidatus Marsarchaeota archaeon]|nr:hypothetical protein [Candidatus Marsarchaeota archaeon]MCL5418813.1 hypothetical protein [Candidatus Marsarchaeota archaeon]
MFGNKKGQSAMEYLMTYGWAILIIAIVLAALFSLGVFSSTSFTGTTCVASSGYLCSNPVLHNGNFIATIGQATGTTWTGGTEAFCFVPSGNTLTSAAPTCPGGTVGTPTFTTFSSGQSASEQFTGVASTATGTVITGTIWAVYQTASSNNNYYEAQIATVTAKAV